MQHQRCVCPQCGTTLRVKDRAYFNRPVPCPECRTLVVIVPVGDDALEVRLADVPADASSKPTAPISKHLEAVQAQNWSPNVIVVSWLAALVVGAMIAGAALWPRPTKRPTVVEQPVEPQIPPEKVAKVEPVPQPAPPVEKNPTPPDDPLADVPIEPLLAIEPEPIESDFPPADAALVVGTDIRLPPAAPIREIDFDTALAQPLLEFRQDRSLPRRDLLLLLEELLGAPIRYDENELGDAAKSLERPISFSLERITVGDVLAKVLEGTELTAHREPDGLRLKPASDTPGP